MKNKPNLILFFSFVFFSLTLFGCALNRDINPNEYSKLLLDLEIKRNYPILRTSEEVPMLVKALSEKNNLSRYNAAQDLRALGSPARDAFIPLINRFTDNDSKVAQMCFEAAQKVMGEPYIPPPKASWFFGTEKVDDPVDPLNKYINGNNDQLKIWSFLLLSKMNKSAKPAIPTAINALKSSNSDIRYQAQFFLQNVDANISKRLIAALSDKDPRVRSSVCSVLGLREDQAAKEEIRKLLNDSDSSVKYSAAEALARLGETSNEIGSILSSGLGSLSPTKEAQIIKLLNKIGYNTAVNSYYSKKVSNQKQAQGKLKSDIDGRARVASQKVREKLLKDRDKLKRAEATSEDNLKSALVEIPKRTAEIEHGKIPQRLAALKALASLAPYHPNAFQPILDALNNENAGVRATAAKILGDLRKVEAVDDLIAVLQDESVDVQDSAVAALTIIGTPEALNAISAFPEDMRNEAVKRALRDTSGQIQALVRCSEARSLCKLVLQDSGSPVDTLNEEAAACAYLVQPGC